MRMMKRTTLSTIALAASVAVVLTGCGNDTSSTNNAGGSNSAVDSGTPVDGGTLTMADTTKWEDMFIPYLNNASPTFAMWELSFEPLMSYDKSLNIKPNLAQSWSYSNGNKTLDIKLDPNAKWSDGKPITSDDVLLFMNFIGSKVYNTTDQGEYGYLVQPVVGSEKIASGAAQSFANTGGFKKISNTEFQINFSKADAAVLAADVSSYIPLPAHVLGKIPFSQWMNSDFNKKPTVVSSAYIPTQVNGQSSVEYDENDNYFKGKPHISHIVLKYVSEDVLPSLIENGQVDMNIEGNNLDTDSFLKMEKDPNLKTIAQPAMSYGFVGMKVNEPKFQNVQLRQAMEYAIDKQAIIQGVYKGLGKPAYGPIPYFDWAAATPADGMNTYAYNPTKAKQLLEQAGYTIPSGQKWRIDPKTGKPLVFHLVYSSGSPEVQAICTAVAQNLQAVGLNVQLETPLDFNVMLKKIETNDSSLDMFFLANGIGTDPDPRGSWMSTDPGNLDSWKDPKNDALIDDTFGAKAFNQTYRKQAFVKWQLYVNQQVPMLFLYDRDDTWAYSAKVHIPADSWIPGGYTNIQDWWISQ